MSRSPSLTSRKQGRMRGPTPPKLQFHLVPGNLSALDEVAHRQLADLFGTCFPDCSSDEPPAEADWRWLVLADDRIVCQASLRRCPGSDPIQGHLAYVGTHPSWRGRGLAAEVLRRVQTDCQDLGIAVVVLHAAREALGLYLRLGWTEIAPTAWYLASQRHDPDPVLAWARAPDLLEGLRCERHIFNEDW